MGALPCPLPGAWLRGSSLPHGASVFYRLCPSKAQGNTRRNNHTGSGQIPSPGVSFCSNNCSSQSALAWKLQGWVGTLICTAQMHPVAGVPRCPLPSMPPPVPGECQSQAVSSGTLESGACPTEIALLGPQNPLALSPCLSCHLSCSQGPTRFVLQTFTGSARCMTHSPPGVHFHC